MSRNLSLILGTAACSVSLVLPAQPWAATPYQSPRTSFGQPDIGGDWTNASLTPESRPASLGDRKDYTPQEVAKLEAAVVDEVAEGNQSTDPNAPPPKKGGEVAQGIRPEFAAAGGNVGGYNRGWLDPGNTVMRVNGEPRTSIITTANGQAPPAKAGAPTGPGGPRGMGSFDNPENRSLGERCIIGFGRNGGPPMLANGFYNNNYNIVQTPTEVAIETEMVHDVRHIRLNATGHLPSNIRPWFGDSIGHWEGDTLVVETTNIPQAQAYHGSWQDLKVTERFTRTAPDRLRYQFTIEDPSRWDRSWGGEYEFAPLNGRVLEYACAEGNYALEGMLAGARQADRTAAAESAAGKPGA